MNFNYVNKTVDMFMNGKKIKQTVRKPLSLPDNSESAPLILRFGHYFYDNTPLIGKVVDINVWDR